MHHFPSGPPFSARISGAVTHGASLVRAVLHRALPARLGRLVLGAVVTTTVVALVLAIPVVSGVGAPAVTLDSSSTSATSRSEDSPVVMGMDGRPVDSADFAGVTTAGPAPSSAPKDDTVAAGPAAPAEPAPSESDGTPAPTTTGTDPADLPPTGETTSTPAGSPSSSAPWTRTAPPSTPTPAPATPPAAPAETPVEAADPVAEALALVNGERDALGCDELDADPALAAAAQAHSATMSATGVLGLDGLVGAVAQGADAQSVVAGWLADAAASAPLLDCTRTSAGIAVVDGWWTVLVA